MWCNEIKCQGTKLATVYKCLHELQYISGVKLQHKSNNVLFNLKAIETARKSLNKRILSGHQTSEGMVKDQLLVLKKKGNMKTTERCWV